MPTVLRWRGRRFYFYSSDGDEPPHVHVDHGGRTIKVWLHTLKVAYNDGYTMREVSAIPEHGGSAPRPAPGGVA